MRSILVLNPKGGSGKTTIATHIAAWYALAGKQVALVDYDVQRCALDWLESRPTDRPVIHGVDGTQTRTRVPRNTEVVVMDAPAATHGKQLSELLRRAQTCIIPVVPSPVDLHAASRFIDELVEVGRVLSRRVRVATIANRVRENSPGRLEIEDFLRSMKLSDGRRLPFVAALRNTQNYVHAAERGLSVFEIAPSRAAHDVELWEPLLGWLESRRSLPT
ncbi:MAG: AAA family ATPase [Ectothiorhodospiraceae bacterium]|nr:AAA family ATPase [Chromatiales bacterium]MCP5156324.1 AAA family ATPase [Ectothiorhodospiraceae bacterium]